jgi:ribosomal protein L11 methyltransferase
LSLAEGPARLRADAIADDEARGRFGVDLLEADGGWRVSVYFAAAPTADERSALAAACAAAGVGGRFAISALPDADWVRQSLEGLKPVRAGRFLVHGSHDRRQVAANDIGLEIEAGLAFGTGHHGTTAACLVAIDRIAGRQTVRNALDVGTGTGVLAIAIAKRTRAHVLASDIDPVATAVARENVRLNGVPRSVVTITADGLNDRRIRAGAPYDLVVANILAGPLVSLAPAIRRVVAGGSAVVLSGILTAQARRVAAIYRTQGFVRDNAIVMGEWTTLTMRVP